MPRSSARRGSRQREVRAELRWQTVALSPPAPGQEPLRLQLVHVWERSPAPGGKALEWFLLTTLPVASLEDAERVLHWYRPRRCIEDWYRMLKSGCKAGFLDHQDIARTVTIKAVSAWRIAVLTLLVRTTPELPATVCFTPHQLRVLRDFATQRRLDPPRNLGLALRTMAILGGYLYRPNASPPGHKKIWEGWTRLSIMSETYAMIDSQKLRPGSSPQEL